MHTDDNVGTEAKESSGKMFSSCEPIWLPPRFRYYHSIGQKSMMAAARQNNQGL
jgi:hypothetical protein